MPVIRLGSHGLGTAFDSAGSSLVGRQPPLWVLAECKGLRLTAHSRRCPTPRQLASAASRRKMSAHTDEAQLLQVRHFDLEGALEMCSWRNYDASI